MFHSRQIKRQRRPQPGTFKYYESPVLAYLSKAPRCLLRIERVDVLTYPWMVRIHELDAIREDLQKDFRGRSTYGMKDTSICFYHGHELIAFDRKQGDLCLHFLQLDIEVEQHVFGIMEIRLEQL